MRKHPDASRPSAPPARAQSPRERRWRVALLALGLALFGTVGCAVDEGVPQQQTSNTPSLPCVEGTWQRCYQQVDATESTVTCYEGAQQCSGGVWGACQNGTATERPKPDLAALALHPTAITTAVSCANNPCDPSCMKWDEPGPLTPGAGSTATFDWQWCDPTSASCAPTVTPPPACSHGLCTTGGGLNPNCDPCVAKICANATYAGCCDDPATGAVEGNWDETCEKAVFSICAETTPPTTVGVCDFGMVSRGSFTVSNGNGVYTYKGPVVAQGNFSALTDDRYRTIYATGDVHFMQRNTVQGDVIADGNFFAASDFHCTGNLFVKGTVSFDGPAQIDGSIVAGGNVHTQNPSLTVGGKIFAPSTSGVAPIIGNPSATQPVPPNVGIPTIPTRTVSAGGTNCSQPVGGSSNCAAGSHNSLDATNGGQIDMISTGGLYQFNSVNFGDGGSTVNFHCGWDGTKCAAMYDIRVSGNLYFGNNMKLTCSDCPARTGCSAGQLCQLDTFRIQWYTDSNFSTGTPVTGFYGVVIVPNGSASINNSFSGKAMVWAKGPFTSGTDIGIDSLGMENECKSMVTGGSGAIVQSQCPILGYSPRREPCQSGEDCQANSRCDSVQTNLTATATVPACAHPKCTLGAGLDPKCDPCVKRVVDAQASCQTSWDATCVARVKSDCDANCPTSSTTNTTLPATPCAHSPCTTGAALTSGCDTPPTTSPGCSVTGATLLDCVTKVCGAIGTCCTGTWDATCVQEAAIRCQGQARPAPPTSGNLCDYGAVATTGFVSGPTGGTILGGAYSTGNLTVSNAPAGSLVSGGNVDFGANAVSGNVVAAGTITGTGTVSGVKSAGVAIPATGFTPKTITAGTVDKTSCADVAALTPGSYANVSTGLWWGACGVIGMAPGDYYVSSFTLQGTTKLKITAPGTVRIFATGNVLFDSGTDVLDETGTALSAASASRLQVRTNGNITLQGWPARPVGYFAAPNGRISITGSTVLKGLAAAKEIDLQSGTTIDGSANVGAVCKASTWDQGTNPTVATGSLLTCNATPAVPLTTTVSCPVNGTGTCASNAAGYVDSAIAGLPDLAAAVPCDKKLPICNQGSAAATGTLKIGFWNPTTGKAFTSAPMSSWQIGECTLSINIQPGYCQTVDLTDATVTCSGITPSTDMTTELAILLNSTKSFSEYSLLDDWTLYKPGQTCTDVCAPGNPAYPTCMGGGATKKSYVQRYEATCPTGQGPQWSMLMWNGSIPGAAQVTFEYRTAMTSAGLGDQDTAANNGYIALATKGTSTRQVCDPYSLNSLGNDDPDCPVMLASKMGLPDARHAWVDLKITVDPVDATGTAASLAEWQLAYSCLDNL